MKFFKVSLFFALLVAVCFPAVAQTGVRAEIPFNFMVAGKNLPAGQYKVEPAWPADHSTWRIYNDHASVVVLTNWDQSPQTAHSPSLVFVQSAAGYSLLQIWPTAHSGRDLMQSKAQRTLVADRGNYVEVAAK